MLITMRKEISDMIIKEDGSDDPAKGGGGITGLIKEKREPAPVVLRDEGL